MIPVPSLDTPALLLERAVFRMSMPVPEPGRALLALEQIWPQAEHAARTRQRQDGNETAGHQEIRAKAEIHVKHALDRLSDDDAQLLFELVNPPCQPQRHPESALGRLSGALARRRPHGAATRDLGIFAADVMARLHAVDKAGGTSSRRQSAGRQITDEINVRAVSTTPMQQAWQHDGLFNRRREELALRAELFVQLL